MLQTYPRKGRNEFKLNSHITEVHGEDCHYSIGFVIGAFHAFFCNIGLSFRE